MKLDLNCDLGEGEPIVRTRALMRWITSANVACGGHAGDAQTMEACVRLAAAGGVHLGAHPGPWARNDFGRSPVSVTPDELELLLLQQVGALERIAQAHRVRLHHVKLHGALYHATDADEALARRYLRVVGRWWPRCVVYARAGGLVARLARVIPEDERVTVWPEAFADRGYRDDGTLVPRGEPCALLKTAGEVRARGRLLAATGAVESVSGGRLELRPRTVCVHSDSPEAARRLQQLSGFFNDGSNGGR